jgi:mono/diheme cytochrome c family protein
LISNKTKPRRRRLLLWGGVVGLSGILSLPALSAPSNRAPDSSPAAFAQNVGRFVKQNCAVCHNEQLKTAGLVLTKYHDTASVLHDRLVWEKVVARVRGGEMPPKGLPRPKAEDIAATTAWVEAQFAEFDRSSKPDPGHLTAHRLNRVEYNNTVRDLLGVTFRPAADFPADDSGYGFDNIGDVLSVSPVLMEKYLGAAKKIAGQAIPSGSLPKPTRTRFSPEHDANDDGTVLEHAFDLPAEGDYDLRATVSGRKDALRIRLELDGKEIQTSDVVIDKDKPRSYELRMHVPYGEHVFRAVLTTRQPSAAEVEVAQDIADSEKKQFAKQVAAHPEDEAEIRKQHKLSNPPTYLDALYIQGPFHALPPPLPEAYRRIFICGHAPGHHTAECARTNLAHLARLAYRRPVDDAEVAKLTALVAMGQKNGLSLDQSMRLGVEAILVSPNFLYRIEHDPNPSDPAEVHPVNGYELASRLSYFLWSSMPDEELFQAAGEGRLCQPKELHAQVQRMLKDPKAEALVDNFAGQWLELRNLDSVRPDPDQFPQFNKQLREAMYTETRMFVTSIIHDDRSILDFIDGKYTFVNQRLAKFYGIPGVTGDNFRRVSLKGTERSGVLTQASVLTVTSYPTRTSPVLRGKWILENVLNQPPPPPPPGVGSIDAKGGPVHGTMRQQMEAHRVNPMCAGCHMRMDPLGFSMENYNAIGQWRTHDGNLPIDATGVLPGGKTFNGPEEMKRILVSSRDTFAQCFTEKLMIYALGRGLESYDRPAAKKIAAALAANDYRFSVLIDGIVDSVPFQMGRADGGSAQ